MFYDSEKFLDIPVGNNTIDFENRKKYGSEGILRIPPLIDGTLQELSIIDYGVAYEYINESNTLISSPGLESLLYLSLNHKDIYIMDNHNHAFSFRWRSYMNGIIDWGSSLIHIDQHSDYNEPLQYLAQLYKEDPQQLTLEQIDDYANNIIDIASFIKPALQCGLVKNHTMVLSEYKLLTEDIVGESKDTIILDIDIDFWEEKMSINEYQKTIDKVKKIMNYSSVKCITIATSPTYIDQKKAINIIKELLS